MKDHAIAIVTGRIAVRNANAKITVLAILLLEM